MKLLPTQYMTNSTPPETDTPQTDQFWETSAGGSDGLWHARDFCREMERERDCLRDEMKELYNCASFDWETMPEAGRRRFQQIVLETADKALSIRHFPQ